MVADFELWYRKFYEIPKVKKYLDFLVETKIAEASGIKTRATAERQIYDSLPDIPGLKWGGTAPPYVDESVVLNYFQEHYSQTEQPSTFQAVSLAGVVTSQVSDPSVNMGLSIIPTASAEPEPISLPSVYGAQYVPDVVLQRPGELYSSLGQTVELSKSVEYKRVKVIDIATGIVVFDGSLTVENIKLHQDDPRYSVEFVEPEPDVPEPVEETVEYWVKKPSGKVERLKVLPSHIPQYESIGWVFELYTGQPNPFEPDVPEPVGIPGKFNTNILVGLLAGGVLAVPILDDLLKTKKKRRR